MFQNSNNTREHSITTKKLNYNFTVYNAQGPNCYVNLKLNYGRFFADHIKIFNLNYGRHLDQFVTTSQFIINESISSGGNNSMLQEVASDYSNSRFYVGIQEDLIDNVIDLASCSIEWSLDVNVTDEETGITTLKNINIVASSQNCINPNELSTLGYDVNANTYKDSKGILHKYYIFEINYINQWYDNINDNVTLKIDYASYSPELYIKYKWKKQQQTSDINIFKHNLGFNFVPNLQGPDLVNTF